MHTSRTKSEQKRFASVHKHDTYMYNTAKQEGCCAHDDDDMMMLRS